MAHCKASSTVFSLETPRPRTTAAVREKISSYFGQRTYDLRHAIVQTRARIITQKCCQKPIYDVREEESDMKTDFERPTVRIIVKRRTSELWHSNFPQPAPCTMANAYSQSPRKNFKLLRAGPAPDGPPNRSEEGLSSAGAGKRRRGAKRTRPGSTERRWQALEDGTVKGDTVQDSNVHSTGWG